MPIIKVEIANMEDADLGTDLLRHLQDSFVAAFGSERRYVDVRVATFPPSRFLGQYEPGDGPIYVEVTMHTLPEINKRREAVAAFSTSVAAALDRDVSAVNLVLNEAPKDRFAYGGSLLCDLSN